MEGLNTLDFFRLKVGVILAPLSSINFAPSYPSGLWLTKQQIFFSCIGGYNSHFLKVLVWTIRHGPLDRYVNLALPLTENLNIRASSTNQ